MSAINANTEVRRRPYLIEAAELSQRRCTGCQLEVNAADLRVFAAAADDDVLRCEECSRILVRTASSSL